MSAWVDADIWSEAAHLVRECVQYRWPSIEGLRIEEDQQGGLLIYLCVGGEWRTATLSAKAARSSYGLYAAVVEAIAQKMRLRFMRYRKTWQ